MKKIPLAKSNPYMRNPEKRRSLLIKTVNSSSAIEGITYKIPIRKKKAVKINEEEILHDFDVFKKTRR